MNPQLIVSYRLVGTGWSECEVSFGKTKAKLSASYLSDALGKLVQSALAVATGFHSVEFGFDEEPGEYRWSIESVAANRVRVRIVALDELWSYQALSDGRAMFEATMTQVEYASSVQVAASTVLREHGLSGYAERWAEHRFPSEALELLEAAIAALSA